MVNYSSFDYLNYEARHKKPVASQSEGVDDESRLHQQIMDYCDAQWPRWKYIRCRMDKRSTIAKGAQDFTIFAPGRVLCVECKARNEKPTSDQQIWHKEMEMVGHSVYVVLSFDDFKSTLRDLNLEK